MQQPDNIYAKVKQKQRQSQSQQNPVPKKTTAMPSMLKSIDF